MKQRTLEMNDALQATSKLRTGIAGFDHIAWGGHPEGRSTLVVGGTGTGKSLCTGSSEVVSPSVEV